MKRVMALALLIPLIMVACGEAEKPPEKTDTPPPPPEPTVAEIKQEFAKPLSAIAGVLTSGQAVPPEMEAQVMQELRGVEQKFAGKVNLPQAKTEAADVVEPAMKQAEQMENWAGTLTAANILAFFEPNNPSLGPTREHATKEMNRPRLGKPSFITDKENNITTVFIEVTFPDKKKTESYHVREGDDFADGRFRLLKVIGRNQGVRVLDVEDSKEMDIMRRERD